MEEAVDSRHLKKARWLKPRSPVMEPVVKPVVVAVEPVVVEEVKEGVEEGVVVVPMLEIEKLMFRVILPNEATVMASDSDMQQGRYSV